MKRNKKTAILLCISLLGITAVLSGCIDTVETLGWENSSDKYCAVLKGAAPESHNNFQLVKVKFVYDENSHESWQDYKYTIENDNIINEKSFKNIKYFEGETFVLDQHKSYFFRAVGLYAMLDGSQEEMWVAGQEISFCLMQGSNSESIIE